jgi:hypothetical protein
MPVDAIIGFQSHLETVPIDNLCCHRCSLWCVRRAGALGLFAASVQRL